MAGSWCDLEPLAEAHAAGLFEANALDEAGRGWTYLPYGPFESFARYRAWVEGAAATHDPQFFAIVTPDGPVGVASYLRIAPEIGSLEVGHIRYAPRLQKTVAATEAMYLMMRRAFDELGYRRYEWKCDALNAPSRRAAERIGFTHEGVFRQATIYKSRNRDTAWYSVVDGEWPRLRTAFQDWLDPVNFDDDGRQRRTLEEVRATAA